MNTTDKIYVAGHKGLVGSSLVRALREQGYKNLVLKTRQELDLTHFYDVEKFFQLEKPDYVFLAAAKCGGIADNIAHPVEFLKENLNIQNNIIHNAHVYKTKKLMYLGSACIYPRECPQPIKEEYLMTGPLEPTNESYSLAKIAGIKLCEAYYKQYGDKFISVQPSNVYGPGEQEKGKMASVAFQAHREGKFKLFRGNPKRDFVYINDVVDATIYPLFNHVESGIYEVGSGESRTFEDVLDLMGVK